MSDLPSVVVCSGCDEPADPAEPYPFRCLAATGCGRSGERGRRGDRGGGRPWIHGDPFARGEELSDEMGFDASGGVWLKDETGNLSGSHKARHLMGAHPAHPDRRADRSRAGRSHG